MKQRDKPGLSRTSPFPNALIDEVMPCLNDTQWRVLCVIVRQTLGWHDRQTGTRKARDWLTQSQLKARTGRNTEALAAAIETLVKQDYIVVEGKTGNPLDLPEKRRAYRDRCYYRLADVWLQRIGLRITKFPGKDLMHVARVVSQHQERRTEFDGIEKSNRTKETQTKEKALPLTGNGQAEPYSAKVQEFIASFEKTSQECLGTRADTAVSPGQLASLRRLLRNHAEIDWKPYLQMFFRSDFQYAKRVCPRIS